MGKRLVVAQKDTFKSIALAAYGDGRFARPLANFNGYRRARKPTPGVVIELPRRSELSPPRYVEAAFAVPAGTTTLTPPHGLDGIIATFGDIDRYIRADGTIDPTWEAESIVSTPLPFPITLGWGDPPQVATRIRCHRLLAQILGGVFRDIDSAGLRGAVKTYGGCYNFRAKRTGIKLSTHSWGIAIDVNPNTNAQGTSGDMPPMIVDLFRARGFKWGGDWAGKDKDPMHFQFCTGY
ncbi:MAG: hypothetical protein C5B46_09085 [Proteobacteria bacterium]|nr:MAG: hypothetical protein C5B46_09085 [Pseudomonadota bacterium]